MRQELEDGVNFISAGHRMRARFGPQTTHRQQIQAPDTVRLAVGLNIGPIRGRLVRSCAGEPLDRVPSRTRAGQTRRPSGVCGGRDSGVSRVLSPKLGPRCGPGDTTAGHKPAVRLVRRADFAPRTGGPEIGIVSAVPLMPDDEPSISPLMSSSSQRQMSPGGRCLAVGHRRRVTACRAGRSLGLSRILASPCGGNDAHTAGSSRDQRYGHSVRRVRRAVRRASAASVILNGREVPGGLIEPPPPR